MHKVKLTVAYSLIILLSLVMFAQNAQADTLTPSGEVQVHINPDTYVELYCNDGVDLVVVTNGEDEGYAYCFPLNDE